LPILLSESDWQNTFLSLISFRNPEAALLPTEAQGCWVTAKHYSAPGVSPPSRLKVDWASEKRRAPVLQPDTETLTKGSFPNRKDTKGVTHSKCGL